MLLLHCCCKLDQCGSGNELRFLVSSCGCEEERVISLFEELTKRETEKMDAKAKLLEQKKQKSLKRQRKRDEDVHGKNKRARIGDGSGGKVKKPKSPDFLVKSFRLGAKPWNAAAVPPPSI